MMDLRLPSSTMCRVAFAIAFTLIAGATEAEAQLPVPVIVTPDLSGDPGRDAALSELAERVRDRLNLLSRVDFDATLGDPAGLRELGLDAGYVSAAPTGSMPVVAGEIARRLPAYRVVGLTSNDLGAIQQIDVIVADSSGVVATRQFESPPGFDDRAVEQIADFLEVTLGLSIRIAVMPFRMSGGDRDRFEALTTGLPHMVAEGLKVSTSIVLVESFNRDSILDQVLRGAEGFVRTSTILEANRYLNANYFVMGEFWELGGKIQLSLRCVAMESGEIIATRGATMPATDLDTINAQVARLTAELREAIELDYSRRERPPRYLAVAGYQPYPATGENRAILLELVRTLNQKLRAVNVPGLRVREDPQVVESLASTRYDPWEAGAALGADALVSIDLDRADRDRWRLSIDYFDRQTPRAGETFPPTLVTPATVDSALNAIVPVLVGKFTGRTLPDSTLGAVTSVTYRGPLREDGFRFGFGGVSYSDPALFLDVSVGATISAGYVVNPARTDHLQFELFRSRLSLFGSRGRGQRAVGGLDVMFATLGYRFRPLSSVSPYVGVGAGLLGVLRFARGDLNYDGRFGAGVQVGIERIRQSGQPQRIELEVTRAFSAVDSHVLSDLPFEGGRPGGVYFTVYLDPR